MDKVLSKKYFLYVNLVMHVIYQPTYTDEIIHMLVLLANFSKTNDATNLIYIILQFHRHEWQHLFLNFILALFYNKLANFYKL